MSTTFNVKVSTILLSQILYRPFTPSQRLCSYIMLHCRVMAVNELDFPNPGSIGDASEYKVSPLYPLDTLSSDHQSSGAIADIERETVFANKGSSGAE